LKIISKTIPFVPKISNIKTIYNVLIQELPNQIKTLPFGLEFVGTKHFVII